MKTFLTPKPKISLPTMTFWKYIGIIAHQNGLKVKDLRDFDKARQILFNANLN